MIVSQREAIVAGSSGFQPQPRFDSESDLEPDMQRPPEPSIVNAMTIDVEDYFQVSALAPYVPRSEWDALPCRVERNVDLILGLCDDADCVATFFILGWIAERFPSLIRRIAEAGHEIASHGYGHERANELTPGTFGADVSRAKCILEDLTGQSVLGYRAPSFSIDGRNPWALDGLLEAGYVYSSSIYPVAHDHYGMPGAPRFAYAVRADLLEVPPATVRIAGRNLPAGGGGWFRLLPYVVSRALIRRINRIDGQPAIFYLHPWELDPGQPRIAGIDLKTRFRHYVNIERTEGRLRRLLREFEWGRVDRLFLDRPAPTSVSQPPTSYRSASHSHRTIGG